MSQNFSVQELTFSQLAVRRGIDNTPTQAVLDNLHKLMALLEEVRLLSGPLMVSSGYRCPALNVAAGGATDSAHTLGLAADISCRKFTPKALAMLIRDSGIEYDQLILEGTWVHLALWPDRMRREELTARFAGGKATYTRGIA